MGNTTRPPGVCILLEQFYPHVGGVQVHSKNLAEKLIENGLRVFVITRRLTSELAKQEQINGVPVYRLWPNGTGQLKKWLMAIAALVFLLKTRKQYDIIYVPFFRILAIPAVLASKCLRRRCVLREAQQGELSGRVFDQGLQTLRLSRSSLIVRPFLSLRNWLVRRADIFVSISSEITREYIEDGIEARKIQYIPHGVDSARYHPVARAEKLTLRDKLGLPVTKVIVTFIGRLVSLKGLPLLIRAWKEIAAAHTDAYLVLVGGGEGVHDCEEELKEFVRIHALGGSVYFAGKRDNVPEYLQASDIFVLPSENEGFSNALLEAMACALAVIVRPSGAKDIIVHLQNGILAPGYIEFINALTLLFSDKSLMDSLGQAARQTILAGYTMERMAKGYVDLFCSLRGQEKAFG